MKRPGGEFKLPLNRQQFYTFGYTKQSGLSRLEGDNGRSERYFEITPHSYIVAFRPQVW